MRLNTENLLMIIFTCFLLYLIYYGLRSWLNKPISIGSHWKFEFNDEIIDHPAVTLLEEHGYEVVSDKMKVPLTFDVNGKELHSRIFIDYIVTRHQQYYLVRTSKERLNMEWTGSGVRKELLPYLLLYPECAGVLFVDLERNEIKVVKLTSNEDDEE